MPPLKPIRNEAEYRAALAALSRFFDSNPDTASQESSDYHKALAALVEQYEAAHHPINTHKKHQPQSWCNGDIFKNRDFLNIFP